jgi:hypothetical protein
VVEPERAVFAKALSCRDLTQILGAPELFWHLGEEAEAVVMTLDALPLGRLRVLRLPSPLPLTSEYFRRVDAAVRRLLDRREVNLNTLRRFGRLWIRNLTANLREFVASPGVGQLRGSFDGVPALVLAAGPSLDAVLPFLAELQRRMLLVAVDTSFRLCREAGVEPDLLVTVDPQYWNTRHLDRAHVEEAVLVSESSAHPRLFRSSGTPDPAVYFVSSFFPLGRILEDALGSKGQVGAGGSVATTAWDLARLLGCRPIYMAGLDLGYPGARTHCRGAYFEERMHQEAERLHPAETARFQALRDAGPFLLGNPAGGFTLTDRRLIIYKWWFENQIAQLKDAGRGLTYSLSAEGVRVEGMPFRSLEELRQLPENRRLLRPRLADIRRRAREHREGAGRNALNAAVSLLEDLVADLRQLEGFAARAVSVCRRLPGPEGGGPDAAPTGVFVELDRIDAEILAVSSRNVAGFLFQDLIRRILDSPGGRRSLQEVMQLSEELYRELSSSAAWHRELLEGALREGPNSLKFP